jgi:hypothetical protein
VKAYTHTPWIFFAMAVALPACGDVSPSVDATHASLVTAPASCGTGDPTCNEAIDYPTQLDLSVTNSQDLVFSSTNNALGLVGGSGVIVDTDGDGVPDPADDCPGTGWRLPCDGDASNDGAYQTAYFDMSGGQTVSADVQVQALIKNADVYILMDATGSMGGEQAQLVTDLTTGSFVNTNQCPTGLDTGLVGGLGCVIPDVQMGLGQFNEFPLLPMGHPFGYSPYHHYLDITDNLQHLIDAVSSLKIRYNKDDPEATTQALYSVVTGEGLGPWVPNRTGCPAGRWGYPCFRPGVLPIIILFTDDEMYNGPRVASPTYGNPPFDGTVGLSTLLPPVVQDPGVLYSGSVSSSHNFGDLTSTSLTVMGSNANHGNDVTSWTFGACNYCPMSGCWGDGRDGIVRFSLSSALPSVFVSGEGTFYPYTNLTVIDSGLNIVDCNRGPGGGDYWGRVTMPMAAGTWYIASDAAVGPSSSVNNNSGPYQIRIQTTATDPSWATRTVPIPWTDVETEVLAAGIKLVQIKSPGDGDNVAALADVNALGVATGSVDQFGNPYVESIAGDGSGLSTALLDAVRALVGDTRRDVTVAPEDNPATPTVDETLFVSSIEANKCPTNGNNNCTGGEGTNMCLGCLADAKLQFRFRVGNDFIPSGATAQVFDFDMVVLVDGATEIDRFPMRVMVPPTGGSFGSGHYQNTYDSDFVCVMPPERPDWGALTWIGSTPSDSTVEFEFFTGNTLAELDNQIPVSIIYPTDTTAQTYDIGNELIAGGMPNFMPFLRVRATLNASSDSLSTPIFQGWSMQFNCIPFD